MVTQLSSLSIRHAFGTSLLSIRSYFGPPLNHYSNVLWSLFLSFSCTFTADYHLCLNVVMVAAGTVHVDVIEGWLAEGNNTQHVAGGAQVSLIVQEVGKEGTDFRPRIKKANSSM